jgi:hypothetical protein
MAKQRWPDPVTAIRELEDMHRVIWGFATTEEFAAHKKSHKGYAGTGPQPFETASSIARS